MQIDWFTFAAQIVNFLILVGLLKYFLYDRILEAMNRREERIGERLEEARRKEERAEERAEELERARQELEERREEMHREAREEAEAKKRELVEEVREEVDAMEARWKESIERAQASFREEFTGEAIAQIVEIARQVLEDLADQQLEDQAVRRFVARLEQAGEDRREELERALSQEQAVTIRTAWEVTEDHRRSIEETLRTILRREVEVRYRTGEEVGFGIELRAGGWQVAWSLNGYLEGLEEELTEEFEAHRS